MGVAAGPKVVSDGLVLSLDPGNIFKSVDSTSNNFLQNGSFAGGLGVTYEAGSNPTNTIVELENPGDSNYVLRQNGSNTEYQMNIDGGAQGTLSANTQYVMSGWYATSDDYNGGDTMFHARAYSTGGSHNATGNGIGTLLYSVEIGGLTWEYRYETITTPSDYSGNFDWYMGFGTTNTTGYRYYTGLKVEEGSFPSLLDLSRNGNDAKIINGTSYSSANGGSLVFDGVDDYIQLPSTITLLRSSSTISAWVNIDDFTTGKSSTGRNLIRLNGSNFNNLVTFYNGGYSFESSTNSNPHEISGRTTGNVSSSSISAGSWFHFCLVFNSDIFYGYVNSVQTGSAAVANNLSFDRIGDGSGFATSYPAYMKGKIANFKVYDRALTAQEVQQNYNATKSRFGL